MFVAQLFSQPKHQLDGLISEMFVNMIYFHRMHNCDCVESWIFLSIIKAIIFNSPLSAAAKTKKPNFCFLSPACPSHQNWIIFFPSVVCSFDIHKLVRHCIWQFKWFENAVNFAINMWMWMNLNKCETSGNQNRLVEVDFVAVTYRF